MSSERIEFTRELLSEQQLDLLFVDKHEDLRWLTGFTGSNGLAVVGPESLNFYTDFRYVTQAEEQVDCAWNRVDGGRNLAGAALKQLDTTTATRVGFDHDVTTVAALEALKKAAGSNVEFVGLAGPLLNLRRVKDTEEVQAIKSAQQLADAAFTQIFLEQNVVGKTEADLALQLETAMRKLGAQQPSFSSIVAFAEHSALPHAVPRNVVVESGSLLTIDWGAQLDGYCSDCTRTVSTGSVTDSQREVFDTVAQAQKAALEQVKAGASAKQVDAAAREHIASKGFGDYFGHGTGHGVGLEIHEQPVLGPTSKQTLQAGDVVTVEPGIYLPGRFGVRIEELVVVSEDGYQQLTELDNSLVEVS